MRFVKNVLIQWTSFPKTVHILIILIFAMEGRMRNRVFVLALLLSMIAVAVAGAQNLPGGIWSSPQSTATEGRYRSNADDFIRPDNYSGVKFDKWFGMASFLWDANSDAIATVGFATKISNVYLGGFYTGNFWAGAPPNNYTERQFPDDAVPAGGVAGKTYNVYPAISAIPNPVNNAAVLVGVADMGFRLTYRTNFQSFKESNIVTEDQLYKNYEAQGGYIAPQIAWAMAKNLIEKGIRPYATVDLVFERDYQKTEAAGGISGTNVGYSLNHFDPSLGLGLGGYHFYNKNGFRATADFDYVLTLNIYDNEYSYVEDDKYKTGTIKGTYSPGSNPLLEKSYVSNLFTPSLAGSWSRDRLALRFKLNFPMAVIYQEQNSMYLDSANKLIRNGWSESATAFTFRPDLRLAMQYKIVPDRLTLNAGARIQATTLIQRTRDRTNYNNGDEVGSEKVHDNAFGDNEGGGSRFVSRFHLGPTFNFTENAWVEASTGVSGAFGDGAIDVFAPGGLFSFGSILVVLKF
jgi:hypothetical protein